MSNFSKVQWLKAWRPGAHKSQLQSQVDLLSIIGMIKRLSLLVLASVSCSWVSICGLVTAQISPFEKRLYGEARSFDEKIQRE